MAETPQSPTSAGPGSGATTDADALRLAPAAHLAGAMREGSSSGPRGVELTEHPFALQVGLRAVPGSPSADALAAAAGVDLPTRAGEVTGDVAGRHIVWMAPDEFLLIDVSSPQRPEDARPLQEALDGIPGQAVDLSANRTTLVLRGPSARAVLEKGCQLDLHPRVFAAGSAAVTQIGVVPVILVRSAEEEWRIAPRASFADYLVRWLLDGMVEFREERSPEDEEHEHTVRPAQVG
ncbi:MAG: sarcosine oxidase subunit gamma family protein [Brachybacterium sp.]|nr:sarcosine oxidase subunit gamma family protein [Brachybacterium sp.]